MDSECYSICFGQDLSVSCSYIEYNTVNIIRIDIYDLYICRYICQYQIHMTSNIKCNCRFILKYLMFVTFFNHIEIYTHTHTHISHM